MRKLIFILMIGLLSTAVAEGQLYHIEKIYEVVNGVPINPTAGKRHSYFAVQNLGSGTYSVEITVNARAVFDIQAKYSGIINGSYVYIVVTQEDHYNLSVQIILAGRKLSSIAEGTPFTAHIGFVYLDGSSNMWKIARY